jgi:hypothetical protein
MNSPIRKNKSETLRSIITEQQGRIRTHDLQILRHCIISIFAGMQCGERRRTLRRMGHGVLVHRRRRRLVPALRVQLGWILLCFGR